MSVAGVVFDAYGTLFDVHSVARVGESFFPGQGTALSELWRTKQIEYSRVRTMSGRYRPFSELTRDALLFSLKKLKLDGNERATAALLSEYDRLDVFPENRAALAALKAMQLPLAILSNGDPGMLTRVLEHAGLAGEFEHVLSAHEVQRFKTAPEVYALGPRALGAAAADLLFVSSNCWDACGACWFGYQSFWINRADQPLEELGLDLSGSGSSMTDVVAYARR